MQTQGRLHVHVCALCGELYNIRFSPRRDPSKLFTACYERVWQTPRGSHCWMASTSTTYRQRQPWASHRRCADREAPSLPPPPPPPPPPLPLPASPPTEAAIARAARELKLLFKHGASANSAKLSPNAFLSVLLGREISSFHAEARTLLRSLCYVVTTQPAAALNEALRRQLLGAEPSLSALRRLPDNAWHRVHRWARTCELRCAHPLKACSSPTVDRAKGALPGEALS